jgi:hypothetical protein
MEGEGKRGRVKEGKERETYRGECDQGSHSKVWKCHN